MSPLTKIFVMLLVVMSLLNAAATVVYVNKEQASDEANKALLTKNNALQRDIQSALADAATAHGQLVAQEQLSATEASSKQAAMDKANADLASKDAENKQLLNNNQTQEANLQGINAQLAIALQTNSDQAKIISDVRESNGKLVQGQAESEAAVARQRQLAETYGRQVEYLQEQLKKQEDLVKAYSAVINENHLTVPAEPAGYSASATPTGGPAVSGVVQDKQQINGVTYLTISVGSADRVTPGMEFRVVDNQAQPPQFLGILTITQAEANSSVGRLQADNQLVNKVNKGNEVTSEIQ